MGGIQCLVPETRHLSKYSLQDEPWGTRVHCRQIENPQQEKKELGGGGGHVGIEHMAVGL